MIIMKKDRKFNYKTLSFIFLVSLVALAVVFLFLFINYQNELNQKYNLIYDEMKWLENNRGGANITNQNDESQVFIYANNKVIQNTLDEDHIASGYSVFPLIRYTINSESPINDTYRLLLDYDLSFYEREMGYSSSFPIEGLTFKGASLSGKTLYLKFDNYEVLSSKSALEKKIIEWELIKTGLQFDNVEEVIIQPENIF